MNTMGCQDEAADPREPVKPPSVEGGEHLPLAPKRRPDLSTMFVLRDLGMSGVAGGRRMEPSPIERRHQARTIALRDGLRITFSSADRLMEET